ncbi:scavenger receptor cysteine-rich domain-containing protein DMBT1-like isoform X2 [Ptychodera flava]|uniref:scavenger receptor cysteine-rich domain-containing protein DMBT1-like isoform X2 n=1 Tax=Ptychodera flava TaxID=63121 RepID=UPI00396AB075
MLLRVQSVILLTSVFLSTALTDESLFKCDFEHDLCGLYQDQNDDVDWTRQTGSTAPHLDHTLMSKEGHYALIEIQSTQVHSNIARLVMPQVSPGDEMICLEFYHSMHGSGEGELDVYVKPGDGTTMHSVWTKEIDQGNSWLSAEIQIQLQSRFQIILEGHVGDGVTGNIAIDDISLRCGSCSNPETVVTGDTIASGGTDLPQDISEWSSGDDLVCPSYNIEWTSYYTTDEASTASVYLCGSIENIPSGGNLLITSPEYPDFYPNNARCEWIVYAPYSWRHIYVDWKSFRTQSCCDFISAGNGEIPGQNVVIDMHSGSPMPPNFFSTGNSVWIRFVSDESVQDYGFRVALHDTYLQEESTVEPTSWPYWWTQTPEPYNCGETYYLSYRSSVRIETTNYPSNYPHNARCVWFVYAAASWRYLFVWWHDFCTESCCDFVSAGDGNVPGQNVVLNQHSGCTTPSYYYSSGDTIWITFTSDGSVTNKGFSVTVYDDSSSTEWPSTEEIATAEPTRMDTTPDWWWHTTPDGWLTTQNWWDTTEGTYNCGETYYLSYRSSVRIESPNYPSNYPHNARCVWFVYAAASWRYLFVWWHDFCTESCCDFVSAGDGNVPGQNVVLNQHSGCSTPSYYYSSGDTIWITFTSDGSVTNKGFSVTVSDDSSSTAWPTTEAPGSCVGYCGRYNPVDDCYCDSVCELAGDCCPDYAEACPNVTVTCAKTSMKIDINRSILGGMDEDDLQLIDPICLGFSNVTHVTFETTHAACGTTFSETSHHIIYQNTVSNRFADEDVIRRLREVEIPFECVYSRKGRADASFVVDSEKLYLTETGHGNFSFRLDFYHDVSYGTPYYDNEYPIEVKLGERIYVGAAVETNTTDLELFLEKCKGTPTENPNHSTQYAFIENGCIKDATVQLHSVDNPAEKHFSIEAFDFVESTSNVVYIHCDMLVCNATDPFSRCQQGCVLRHRRDVGEDSSLGSRTVTQGPINLYRGDIGIVHGLSQGKETVVESTGQSIMIYAAMAVFVMGSAMAVAAVLYVHHFKRKLKAQVQLA